MSLRSEGQKYSGQDQGRLSKARSRCKEGGRLSAKDPADKNSRRPASKNARLTARQEISWSASAQRDQDTLRKFDVVHLVGGELIGRPAGAAAPTDVGRSVSSGFATKKNARPSKPHTRRYVLLFSRL